MAVMRDPGSVGRAVLSTRTGMPRSIAGRSVLGCSTLAPKYANSLASVNDSSGTGLASGTTRGSALSMPLVSVQISISSTASAAPTHAALKSEPPRPSVVV